MLHTARLQRLSGVVLLAADAKLAGHRERPVVVPHALHKYVISCGRWNNRREGDPLLVHGQHFTLCSASMSERHSNEAGLTALKLRSGCRWGGQIAALEAAGHGRCEGGGALDT